MKKNLISAAFGAGLILATISPIFAANQCGNQTTGPYSKNRCRRLLDKKVRFRLTNNGTVNHTVNTTSNSGENKSNGNTAGNGTVNAGDADAVVDSLASLNTGNLTADQSDPASDDIGLNDTTGPYSKNKVVLKTIKKVFLKITNFGRVRQTINTTATSGKNTSNGNTVGGSVSSGNATSNVIVTTVVNDTTVNITQ